MTWATGLFAVTLFVDDLEAAKRFYADVFELPLEFEDEYSALFKVGATYINLLTGPAIPELIAPAVEGSGHRAQFTIGVDDVDALAEKLQAKGVVFINGPVDRPWGPRTALFADPAGHLWEIAS